MSRIEALEAVVRGLRDLLSLLDGERPPTEALLRTVAECDARLAAVEALPAPADAAERAACDRAAEEALQLNAVARSVLAAEGAELKRRLERVRDLRRGLSANRSPNPSGRSVDVAG